jgi:hypothetical protein
MKKTSLKSSIMAVLTVLLFAACSNPGSEDPTVHVDSVSLDQSTLTLAEGATATCAVTVKAITEIQGITITALITAAPGTYLLPWGVILTQPGERPLPFRLYRRGCPKSLKNLFGQLP